MFFMMQLQFVMLLGEGTTPRTNEVTTTTTAHVLECIEPDDRWCSNVEDNPAYTFYYYHPCKF